MQLVATSFEAKPQPRSFVPKMNNDVLASLEMMLTFGQMMLCLTAQMKKSKPIGLDFLAAEEGFEPSQTESESVVLPLHNSAINSTLTIIAHAVRFVNSFFAIFDFYLKILRRNAEKGCLKAHSESLTAPEKPAELLPFTAGESRCAAVGSLCQLTDNSVKKRSHFFR